MQWPREKQGPGDRKPPSRRLQHPLGEHTSHRAIPPHGGVFPACPRVESQAQLRPVTFWRGGKKFEGGGCFPGGPRGFQGDFRRRFATRVPEARNSGPPPPKVSLPHRACCGQLSQDSGCNCNTTVAAMAKPRTHLLACPVGPAPRLLELEKHRTRVSVERYEESLMTAMVFPSLSRLQYETIK